MTCFEDGSVDLLHIDGLHTYDAVRSDFESWLPKMSNCGVVILHDTTVYEADFGVWQYWRELVARFPAVNLLHGHGLGIVYVGRTCRFGDALRDFAADPSRYDALNAFFRGIGDLAFAEAKSRQAAEVAKASPPGSLQEIASLRTLLDVERAALGSERVARIHAEAEAAAMRNSSSWKISWPLRKLGMVFGRN